jgi:hypothetical protein
MNPATTNDDGDIDIGLMAQAATHVLHEVGVLAITLLLIWQASAVSVSGQQVPDWMVAAISSLLGYFTGISVGKQTAPHPPARQRRE